MPHRSRIYRPTSAETMHIKQTRDFLQQSRDVLREPMPDTFLGRKRPPPQLPEAPASAARDLLEDAVEK